MRGPLRSRLGRFGNALIPWAVAIFLVPEVGRFGPFVALSTGVTTSRRRPWGWGTSRSSTPASRLALLGWIGVTVAAGAVLLRRRDVH